MVGTPGTGRTHVVALLAQHGGGTDSTSTARDLRPSWSRLITWITVGT
jgi:hypothetical protein